jgi:hypothetical protein
MKENIMYWFNTRYRRFLPIVKAQLKDAGTAGVFIAALAIIIPCFILMSMQWVDPERTHVEVLPLPDNAILQGDSIIRRGNKWVDDTHLLGDTVGFIHAGAGEAYPDSGYDEYGWSNRGYMSGDELKGKHLRKIGVSKERFDRKKAEVYANFVDSIKRKSLEICKGSSVPPSIVAAQTIIESAHGTSRLKYVANNFFGHQYKGNVKKKGITGKLLAKDRDKHGELLDYYFRVYESPWWAMKHHVSMLEANYASFRIKADIPERERWMAALCKCKDSRMLASDSDKASYLYAGACAWVAKDKKTSKYVADLRYWIKLYSLDKLDQIWQSER